MEKQERTISELLTLVLKEFKNPKFRNPLEFYGEYNGMCHVLIYLRNEEAITKEEEREVEAYIDRWMDKNESKHYPYMFKREVKAPRLRWLKEHIKLNS
jgi:hypothetical protein